MPVEPEEPEKHPYHTFTQNCAEKGYILTKTVLLFYISYQ